MTEPMFPLTDLVDVAGWGFQGVVPDSVDGILIGAPTVADAAAATMRLTVALTDPIELRIPGIDAFWLVLASTAAPAGLTLGLRPLSVAISVPMLLRVDTNILCPVDANDQPDRSRPTFDVDLGTVDLGIDGDGHLHLDLGTAHLPRCMVGSSGVIVQVGTLLWVTPSTPVAQRPANTPPGFTGVYLDDVEVKISQLPAGLNALRLDDGFIGTGGFSGTVSAPDLALDWDAGNQTFTGALHGDLFGFQGGLSAVQVEFRQNALVGCAIEGDVFVPWFDALIGLELGLTGDGEVSALARMPHSPSATGSTPGGGHLLSIAVGDVLEIGVDSVLFDRTAAGVGRLEVSGSARLTIDGLDLPTVGLKALRIDTEGHVDIEGGWMEVPNGTITPFHGFPLEISKIGFGSEDAADGPRVWVGLSGGITLADGLPVGGSVDGLRISWRTSGPPEVQVSLSGVGIAFEIPDVVRFSGSVAFFDDGSNQGFRGDGHLALPTVGLGVDVDVVIGRNRITGETFFYFHLGVDLPVGIPLAQSGLAFYGFEGLVAYNMGPDKRSGEPWYWGWYVREPRGATGQQKWAVRSGAFAAGLGTTIGTLPDTAYTANAKILLVLVLPGPVLLLEGKGAILRKKPSGSEEGIFEALLVLDVPAQLFQANLAITYSVEKLVTLHGGADIGFSWTSPPPPHFWHVYLGEDEPLQRRWRASLLSLFTATSYFMIEESGLRLGAWVGFDEDWSFGPVRVWVKAEISGQGEVSFDPQHLHGHLHLGGEAGVSVFGAKVVLGASADFDVSGPTPWEVSFDVEAHISIDLWLFSFDWSTTVHLEWNDAVPRLPDPALPIVERVARQHLLIDDGGDLQDALVAPDSTQVVVFHRPVRDLAAIGAPASPTLPADVVGPARFSYQLGHVALHRRTGGGWAVVGASGFVDVNGTTVAAPGLTLENAAGGRLSLVGGQTYDVVGTAPERFTVTGTLPSGRAAYRLRGARPRASVQVVAVTALGAGLATVTLAGDPGIPDDTLGGGTLTAGGTPYAIAGNHAMTIVVRTAPAAPTLPPLGAATAIGPDGPTLEGAWLPSGGGGGATKLMLGARTPFAQFRNLEDRNVGSWGLDPDYLCGPEPVERPTCITFGSAPLGPLDKAGTTVGTLTVTGAGDAEFADVPGPGGGPVRVLQLGSTAPRHALQGVAIITFSGPVDEIRVHATTRESAQVTATLEGRVVDTRGLPVGAREVVLTGPLDQVTIEGTLVTVSEICYLPDWTCIRFEAATFPQGSTGRQSYAGVTLESSGTMSVDGDLLKVTPPAAAVPIPLDVDDFHRRPLPFVPLPDGVRAHPPIVPDGSDQGSGRSSRPVVPLVPGLSAPGDVVLPGLGVVGAVPHARPVLPGRRAAAAVAATSGAVPAAAAERARRVTLRADLARAAAAGIVGRPPADRLRVGGPVGRAVVASVTIYFPRPVTRVRVDVEGAANVTVGAGPVLVASGVATTGAPAMLTAADGWVDRVAISAQGDVEVREVCTDAGDFGWQRFEQWTWQQGVRRSLSSFTSEAPVLAPGRYRLDVVTGWIDEARAGAATSWTTTGVTFQVGGPPGLRSGASGPLNDLATYVDETMPAAGERPFYRSYDVGVSFRRDYVSRMFLENATPLTLGVLDANGREIRPGTANVWGRGPELALTVEEQEWLATLHGSGCVSIDTSTISRNELMHAGAGELLLSGHLHTGVLGTADKPLYTFSFVTSRYASFVHHLAHYAGWRGAQGGNLDGEVLHAPLAPAEQEVSAARTALAGATSAVHSGTPTTVQFDALAAARGRLAVAKDSLADARRAAFAVAASAAGISGNRGRPDGVEVTVVDGAFLLESDEPIAWDRISLACRRTAVVPQRRDVITFPQVEFGGPDAGAFVYRGRQWRTSAELWAKDDRVRARLGVSWALALTLGTATRVNVELDVDVNGSVTLHGVGDGVASDVVVGPGDGQVLSVTGTALVEVQLTGSAFAVRSIAATEPWDQRPARTGVRLVDVGLPTAVGDRNHFVELITDEAVDLAGWRVQWRPADASVAWNDYHVVATVGRQVDGGNRVRLQGGLSSGTAVPGMITWFGGTVGEVPPGGVVVRLIDPSGVVVHERAGVPAGALIPCRIIPDGDLTRAYVVPTTRAAGWWTLKFIFVRNLGAGEPVLSVGGDDGPENCSIHIRV